jgi:hypothetical protein
MDKKEKEMPDKQCIEGVCQFCGKDGYYNEEEMKPCQDIQEGWIGLFDVTAQMGGVYGEWCSRECFWNDLLCKTTTENDDEYEEKKNKILNHVRKEYFYVMESKES